MFKRLIQTGLILASCISMPSWAVLLLDNTDVGGIDNLPAQTDGLANSGEATETAWVNSVIAPATATYDIKIEGDPAFVATKDANVFAANISPNTSDYFIIKKSKWWGLFENVADLQWAVFDASALDDGFKLPTDFTISHITLFNGDGNGVPEPGVLGLLGIGLLGMFPISRIRRRMG